MKFILALTALTVLGAGPTNYADAQQATATVQTNAGTDQQSQEQNWVLQVGLQQDLLYKEEAALNEAIRERNNTVHLGPAFFDTAAYGVSTGFLTWDFLRRTNNLQDFKGIPRALIPRGESAAAAADSAVGAAEGSANTFSSVAIKATEGVSAVVLGIMLVGKATTLGKDIYVRMTDSEEIRAMRQKVVEAEKNLDIAKANLHLLANAQQASGQSVSTSR